MRLYPLVRYSDELERYITCRAIVCPARCLVISKRELPKAGDFVSVWLRADMERGESPEIWRLARDLAPEVQIPFEGGSAQERVMLERLNPPCVMELPAAEILALHKVIGRGSRQEKGWISFNQFRPFSGDHS